MLWIRMAGRAPPFRFGASELTPAPICSNLVGLGLEDGLAILASDGG